MLNNLPLDQLTVIAGSVGFVFVALVSTVKVCRHLLAFLHLLAAQTRIGVLEFLDHVAYNTLYEMGEMRKIEQIPVVAFGVLLWSLLWTVNLYGFILYILVFVG